MDVLEVDDLDMSKLRDRSKKVFNPQKDQISVKPVESGPASGEVTVKVEQSRPAAAGQQESTSSPEVKRQSDLLKDLLGEDLTTTDEKS
jgi:hypothetical protein